VDFEGCGSPAPPSSRCNGNGDAGAARSPGSQSTSAGAPIGTSSAAAAAAAVDLSDVVDHSELFDWARELPRQLILERQHATEKRARTGHDAAQLQRQLGRERAQRAVLARERWRERRRLMREASEEEASSAAEDEEQEEDDGNIANLVMRMLDEDNGGDGEDGEDDEGSSATEEENAVAEAKPTPSVGNNSSNRRHSILAARLNASPRVSPRASKNGSGGLGPGGKQDGGPVVPPDKSDGLLKATNLLVASSLALSEDANNAVAPTPSQSLLVPAMSTERGRSPSPSPSPSLSPSPDPSSKMVDTGSARPVAKRHKAAFRRVRMINGLHKVKKRQERLAHLLLARRDDFERKPEWEKALLRRAFESAGGTVSGALNSSKALRRALADVGLSTKTSVENREMKALCDELCVVKADFFLFVFEAVPRARELLKSLREVALRQDFLYYDTDQSGSLEDEECARILSKQYLWNLGQEGAIRMRSTFQTFLDEVRDPVAGSVNFDGFVQLFMNVQEFYYAMLRESEHRIRSTEGLEAKDFDWHEDELIYIYELFNRESSVRMVPDEPRKGATVADVERMLVELGLLPRNDEERSQQSWYVVLGEAYEGPEMIADFSRFLRMLRAVRAYNRYSNHEELLTMFTRLDKDNSGTLSVKEVNVLVSDLGLMPRCREDQAILQRMIAMVDRNGDGVMSFDEFSAFVQRMAERMQAVKTARQRLLAKEQGFSDKEFGELRDAFYMLEGGEGGLGQDELKKAAGLMKCGLTHRELSHIIATEEHSPEGKFLLEHFLNFSSRLLTRRNRGSRSGSSLGTDAAPTKSGK